MELQRSYCAKWKFKSSDTYYPKGVILCTKCCLKIC
nr:MAG TPA: hypothetical protein [Caudoviricetes sp.]